MKNSNTIFVAHDFTPASKNALNIAAELAVKTGANLFVYNIISTAILTDNVTYVSYTPEKEVNKHKGYFKRSISTLVKKHPTLKADFSVDFGFFLPTLMDKLKNINPWLLILGTKKRTGWDETIFGDTCSEIIGRVSIPTLIIPKNFKVLNLKTVAYAWDGKSVETHQLNALTTILGSNVCSITAINITHHDENSIKNASKIKLALKNKFDNQQVELLQIQGLDQNAEMKKALQNIKPNLLVVYAHHYSFWQSIFHKSFTKQALKFSNSPVLVVY